jgi:shikimate dehydrogenase
VTDHYAVIGNPVAHSKSPRIHAAFAQQTAQDLDYGVILAPLGGFADAVAKFRADGGRGLNVTVPFKLDAYALATELTGRAKSAGAVNTLKFDGAVALGDNTDGAGLVADIVTRLGVRIAAKRVLLMGAGGAARGVVLPLLQQRPAMLAIANRTVGKALALAQESAAHGTVRGGSYADFAALTFDVVVNATSASLTGHVPPLSDELFAAESLAYDMVYGDEPTAFMTQAKSRGAARVADGLGMLIAQAAESFVLWRGVRPDTRPVIDMFQRS